MSEIDAEEAAFRVALGVTWLDANVPGWAERIDLSTLRLCEEGTCVLGQLYGGTFDNVPEELTKGEMMSGGDYPGHRLVELGFDLPAFGYDDPEPEDFVELETEWRRVIAERQAEAES